MERWKRKDAQRRAAVVGLVLLLLLLLWRCGHDGTPSGRAALAGAGEAGNAGGASTPACDGLLEHGAWKGRISYEHSRDVTDPGGRYRIRYAYALDLAADMVERTRREWRGRDELVELFSPGPDGRIQVSQHVEEFDHNGLVASHRFAATGGVNRFEEGMSENGSMMSLVVKADCTYRVFLQAQVLGKATRYDRYDGTRSFESMLEIPTVRGEGIADNGSLLSGTVELPLVSVAQLEANRNNPYWNSFHYAIERDRVAKALGEDKLGTVTVTWHMEAVD